MATYGNSLLNGLFSNISADWEKRAKSILSSYNSNFSNPKVNSNSMPISNKYLPGSPTISNNSKLVKSMSDDSDILMNHAIVDRYNIDWYNKFNRFGYIDPFNSIKHSKEYIFITKPDLNFYDETGSIVQDITDVSTFFADAIDRYSDVADQLQYSKSSDKGPFIQLLSNAINGPLELPGISADTIDTAKNVYGTKISYRGTSESSDRDYDFSLEFKDSRYLEVYMLFKMWDEYERLKWLGQVKPKRKYIENRILHDQVSIYKFIVAEDGMSLLYWARAVGCMPLSVPRDSMSNLDGELTFSTNWKAQFVYDMDPRILIDFNKITNSYRKNRKDLPIFNSDTMTTDGRWARCPYILTRANTSNRKEKFNKYYLGWTI